MNLQKRWTVRVALVLCTGFWAGTLAWAETLEVVTYYPTAADSSADVVRTRTLRVGSALAPFVPSDDQAGLVLIHQALGIGGAAAPEAGLDLRGGVYFEGGNGNVDGDGDIDGDDLTPILQSFAGPAWPLTPGEYARADLNGDGIVSWVDYRMIKKLKAEEISLLEARRRARWLQATALAIDLSGNLGIGTLAPAAPLHVEDQKDSPNVDLVTTHKLSNHGEQYWDFKYGTPGQEQIPDVRMTVAVRDNGVGDELGLLSFSLIRQGALNKVLEMGIDGVKMGWWDSGFWDSVPNGVKNGNLDVNDVYVRSAGRWLSQILNTAPAGSANAAKVYRFQGKGEDPVEMPNPVFLFGWRHFSDSGTLISWNNSPFSKLPEVVIVKAKGSPYWTAARVEDASSIRAFGENSDGFFLVVGEGKQP